MNHSQSAQTHTLSVEPTYLHTSVSGSPPYSIKQDPGFDDKLLRLFTERYGNHGYTSKLCQAQETGNLHLTDLLSANQHIPLNVNEKRRLSSHRAPSPCLAYQPHSAVSLTASLFLWFSLSFIRPPLAPSTISCPLAVTPRHASTPVRAHLFSCCVDVCCSVGTSPEPVRCSSARSPTACRRPPRLPAPALQDTWCCWRRNLSSQPERILRQAECNPKCS